MADFEKLGGLKLSLSARSWTFMAAVAVGVPRGEAWLLQVFLALFKNSSFFILLCGYVAVSWCNSSIKVRGLSFINDLCTITMTLHKVGEGGAQ